MARALQTSPSSSCTSLAVAAPPCAMESFRATARLLEARIALRGRYCEMAHGGSRASRHPASGMRGILATSPHHGGCTCMAARSTARVPSDAGGEPSSWQLRALCLMAGCAPTSPTSPYCASRSLVPSRTLRSSYAGAWRRVRNAPRTASFAQLSRPYLITVSSSRGVGLRALG